MTIIPPQTPPEIRDLLEAEPSAILERIRGDLDLLLALARADAMANLTSWFTEGDPGWQAALDRSGPLGRSAASVAWEFAGRHDVDGAFNGTPASGREVLVSGVTTFTVDDDRLAIRRHIDWAGLFAQLHLSLSWRIPLTD